MKKFIILTLLLLGTFQSYAQFSYSIKVGWSWPDIHKSTMPGHEVNSSLTLGAAVDYQLNAYLGLQSGINYKRIDEKSYRLESGGVSYPEEVKFHASFLEIPLLLSANIKPEAQKWKFIWYAGPYIDIPVEKEGRYETFYGIMVAAQLEVLSHYFVRGEYQWALKSDTDYSEDRRTNMLSVSLGYRF
mgnify:CR=1 FL=1